MNISFRKRLFEQKLQRVFLFILGDITDDSLDYFVEDNGKTKDSMNNFVEDDGITEDSMDSFMEDDGIAYEEGKVEGYESDYTSKLNDLFLAILQLYTF